MTFAAMEALDLCSRGLGLAVLQQAVEGLQLAPVLADLGLNRSWPFGGTAASRRRAWLVISGVRLMLGLGLLFSGASFLIPLVAALNAAHWAGARGTLNGGSDSMTATLGLGLSVAWLGQDVDTLRVLGLYFVAVHAVLSYFVSGVAKLKEPAWRSGTALSLALGGPRYGAPARLLALLRVRSLALTMSYGILLFECLFPLALLVPAWTLAFVTLGAAFHGVSGMALGLHRFVPVWLSTYPAVFYLSGQLAHLRGL